MIPFDWVYDTKKKTMSKFKVGMRVTYTQSNYNVKRHGIVVNIKGKVNPYPIIVDLEGYGYESFTPDGRVVETAPITLKIRDEL